MTTIVIAITIDGGQKPTAWKYWHSYLHWSTDFPDFPLVSTSLPYICPQQIWSESMSYQLQKHIFWFTLLNVIAILSIYLPFYGCFKLGDEQ